MWVYAVEATSYMPVREELRVDISRQGWGKLSEKTVHSDFGHFYIIISFGNGGDDNNIIYIV